MPRNMSFYLTTNQVKRRLKTVTRRLGWAFLQPGDILNAVEKCQGLKKGEKMVRLAQIRVLKTHWCSVRSITQVDCELEGFPYLSPEQFVEFFCATNAGCDPTTLVNRIEFEYI